jgi:hypothetical protein
MAQIIKSVTNYASREDAIKAIKNRFSNRNIRTKNITNKVIYDGVITERDWVLNPHS